jgi:hypothetical protein
MVKWNMLVIILPVHFARDTHTTQLYLKEPPSNGPHQDPVQKLHVRVQADLWRPNGIQMGGRVSAARGVRGKERFRI